MKAWTPRWWNPRFLVTLSTICAFDVSAASLANIRSFLQHRSYRDRSKRASGRLLDGDIRALTPGLGLHVAQSLGITWVGAGLSARQLVGGIDTECDGHYFDNASSIDEKVKHACALGLAGMMSWRLDNDNLRHQGQACVGGDEEARDGSAPTFEGARVLLASINRHCTCPECQTGETQPPTSSASALVQKESERSHRHHRESPFLVSAYVGIFNPRLWHISPGSNTSQPLWQTLPFDSINRMHLAFANISQCRFQPVAESVRHLIRFARHVNPDLEIFITSSMSAEQYMGCDTNQHFSDSLLEVLQDAGLDGFDMDWEDDIDTPTHAALIRQVGKAFRQQQSQTGRSYGLTIAAWPSFSWMYDLDAIRENVQQVNLMTYGQSQVQTSVKDYVDGGTLPR